MGERRYGPVAVACACFTFVWSLSVWNSYFAGGGDLLGPEGWREALALVDAAILAFGALLGVRFLVEERASLRIKGRTVDLGPVARLGVILLPFALAIGVGNAALALLPV